MSIWLRAWETKKTRRTTRAAVEPLSLLPYAVKAVKKGRLKA